MLEGQKQKKIRDKGVCERGESGKLDEWDKGKEGEKEKKTEWWQPVQVNLRVVLG